MRKICKYLLEEKYANTLALVILSAISILFVNTAEKMIYLTSFLVTLMFIAVLILPIVRFKSIVYGRARILFMTPKRNTQIIGGYLLSEIIIFITYFIGICIPIFFLRNNDVFLDSVLINIGANISFGHWALAALFDIGVIWILFMSIGMLSIVLSRISKSKKIKFLSIKIFVIFIILQVAIAAIISVINIGAEVIIIYINSIWLHLYSGFIIYSIDSIIRIIVSVFSIILATKKINNIDIY